MKSCKGLLHDFVECLANSDCVQKEGKSASECGKIVVECQALRKAYFTCKRGQIDNTKRIRGNKGY